MIGDIRLELISVDSVIKILHIDNLSIDSISDENNNLWFERESLVASLKAATGSTILRGIRLQEILSVDQLRKYHLSNNDQLFVSYFNLLQYLHNRSSLRLVENFLRDLISQPEPFAEERSEEVAQPQHFDVSAEEASEAIIVPAPMNINDIGAQLIQAFNTQRDEQREMYDRMLQHFNTTVDTFKQMLSGTRAVTVHNKTNPLDEECIAIFRCNHNFRQYYFIRAQYQSLPERINTLQRDRIRFPLGLTLVKRLHSPNAVRLLKALVKHHKAYIRRDKCIIYRLEKNCITNEAGWTEAEMMYHICRIYDNDIYEVDTISPPPLDDYDILPLQEGEERDYHQLHSDPHLLDDREELRV